MVAQQRRTARHNRNPARRFEHRRGIAQLGVHRKKRVRSSGRSQTPATPINSTSWREIVRFQPPVPPKRRAMELSACERPLKQAWLQIDGDADPVSVTPPQAGAPVCRKTGVQIRSGWPLSVNLTALDTSC